jgi:hypothetical protein
LLRGRLEGQVSSAAEVDAIPLEDRGALRVLEDDVGDGSLLVQQGLSPFLIGTASSVPRGSRSLETSS